MQKNYFSLFFLLLFPMLFSAQITCVQCFRQNDSIGLSVNNMIQNGDFQNLSGQPWTSICPSSASYNCDVVNWTCSGGGSMTYAQVFNIALTGNNLVYLGNYFCHPCSLSPDDTSCILYTSCEVSGFPPGFPQHDATYGGSTGVSLSQTVNGLTPGACYVLEFWAGGEDLFIQRGVFAVDVGFGNTLLPCYATDFNLQNSIGARYLIEFKANAPSHTIKFTNWGHVCSACSEVILDHVRLYPQADLPSSITSCCQSSEFVCDTSWVEIPNVFTPNNDLTNDLLEVKAPCSLKFSVYDRWGRLLFNTEGISVSWDGKFNGKDVTDGVYYYIAEVEGGKKKGFFQLIR